MRYVRETWVGDRAIMPRFSIGEWNVEADVRAGYTVSCSAQEGVHAKFAQVHLGNCDPRQDELEN